MNRRPGYKVLLFKTVSWLLLFTFSWSQIVFAGDLGSTNIGKALERLNNEESNTFAPAYIQYQEISHQELVQIKQDIENLANTRLPTVAAGDAGRDDLTPQSAEAVELKGPQGGSGQSSASSEAPLLTPQQSADVISETNNLVEDGALIDYLSESALYQERADILARNIAIAREGLSVADADLLEAMEKVLSKEGEIAGVLDAISSAREVSNLIRQAIKQFSDESMAALDALSRAQIFLNDTRGREAELNNTLSALKTVLDSEKAGLDSVVLELEFAKIDLENSISLIRQNLGADFDIYSSSYERESGPDGRIISVTLQDSRDELESLVADAKDQVSDSEKASLDDLAIRVEEAKDKVYEDEAISLGQLDQLCADRVNEIISARDDGLADIERQRIDVTAEANRQFESLYASVSAQASYWGSRKAALYQSGQIEAYIYAATMATVYSNQAQSVWSQWAGQIASINQQCDDAIVKLESDAEAAIDNVPAEKEAAIAEIGSQRDSLLRQIDAAALEQENNIYAERDNALAAIDEQGAEALSTIQAEESLILTAWQEKYIADDLGSVIIGKGREVSAAESAYEESRVSYTLFLENVLTPAETSYTTALNVYNEALDNIVSNESALAANGAGLVSLNEESTLLALELSALKDSLAEKTLYRDNIVGLLHDMLDTEKLLMIKGAEMMDYYSLLLAQKESSRDAAGKDEGDTGDLFAVNEDTPSEAAALIDPSVESSISPALPAGTIKESPLLAIPPELVAPAQVAAAGAEEIVPIETEADNKAKELLIRGLEMPETELTAAIEGRAPDSTLLDTFRSLFNRDATEGGIELFNQIMMSPLLPAIKLIDVAIDDYYMTEDGALYHIVDSRVVSATIEDKAYIFDDNGNIDSVLSQNGNEILDYLYDGAGDLESINFSNARSSLETARDSVSSALAEKFNSYRAALDEQKKVLEDEVRLKYSACLSSIDERAASLEEGVLTEYSERMSALENEKTKLGALQNYLEKKATSLDGLLIDNRVYTSDGMAGDIASVRAQIDSIDEAIQRVEMDKAEALRIVDNERAKAVSALDGERDGALASISARIEEIANSLVVSEDAVKAKLESGADDAFSAIKTQEDFGLIRYYFKESLGREPTYDEMTFCAENGYTTKESLSGSVFTEELAARQAFKDSVIENVRIALESDKFSSLSEEDKTTILNYLNSQSLHFGTSALAPLSEALRSQGLEANEAELLTELILSEIMAGNLGQAGNAPLKISMNAMIDVARAHGAELSGSGLTMDELEAALKDGDKSAIALINEDHYVTVLKIDSDTVTYLDPSTGKNGANVTIPKDEFKKKFSGNVIARTGMIDSSKLLSKDKLMAARGAGFWDSIGKFFGWIGDFFCDIFEAIGRFVSNIVSSIVDGINRAIEVVVDVVKNIAMIPVNFVKDIASGNWADALWTVGSLIPGVGAIKSAIEGDWVSAGIQAGALLLGAAIPAAGSAAGGISGTITEFASSIMAPITNMISPFTNSISNVVGAFGNAIGTIASSVGQVFKPVTDLASKVIGAIASSPIGQIVATIKDGIVSGVDDIGDICGLSNVSGLINDFIVTPAVSTGILEGAKVTLTDLGISSTIADIGGAAISGYAGSYLSGNSAIAIPITLGSIASQSFKELGAAFDFNSTLTSSLSQLAGNFMTNSMIDNALSDAIDMTELSSSEFALTDSIDSTITSLELMDRASELDLGPGFYYETSPGQDTRTYAIMSGDSSLIGTGYDLGFNAGMHSAGALGDGLIFAGTFLSEETSQLKDEYIRKRALGDSTLGSLPPVGLIGEEIIYQVAGSAIDYRVTPDSEWLQYVNQGSNIASFNGIQNKEPEGTPPLYEMWDKEYFTPIPMFEGNNINGDVGAWLIDELFGINIVTNEAREKYIAYAERLNESLKEGGVTVLTYSGSLNPNLKYLKHSTEENKDITALVSIGGVSFRGGWFPERMENANLKTIVNVWGSRDFFYSGPLSVLKLMGPRNFIGTPVINVMIIDADHGSYLNSENLSDDKSLKIEYFVKKLTNEAAAGGLAIQEFLFESGATFNEKDNTYIIDPSQLFTEDLK